MPTERCPVRSARSTKWVQRFAVRSIHRNLHNFEFKRDSLIPVVVGGQSFLRGCVAQGVRECFGGMRSPSRTTNAVIDNASVGFAACLVGRPGFEPGTNDLKGRCSTIELSTPKQKKGRKRFSVEALQGFFRRCAELLTRLGWPGAAGRKTWDDSRNKVRILRVTLS
jgi:hypothetical protein